MYRLGQLHRNIAAASMLVMLAGCGVLPPPQVDLPSHTALTQVLIPPQHISEELLNQSPVDLVAITPGMREFVRAYVPEGGSRERRLEALFGTLRNNPEFMVQYNASATRTGAEVFATREGNCLAFSAMFIGLAREAGLQAHFQEVDVPPSWDAANEDTLIQFRHVNVKVGLTSVADGVIDFRMDRYADTYPKRLITDEQALAHFYSNLSMEKLIEGDLDRAYVSARNALLADATNPYIWNNMGIIQRRLGNDELAEASYLRALELNPYDWSAANNLAVIYERTGKSQHANELRAQAEHSKLRNPYYRFALAQNHYFKGNYDLALEHLNAAVAAVRHEHRFYFLRGLSLWQLGDSQSAIADVKKAIKIGERGKDASQLGRSLAEYHQQLDQWQHNNG